MHTHICCLILNRRIELEHCIMNSRNAPKTVDDCLESAIRMWSKTCVGGAGMGAQEDTLWQLKAWEREKDELSISMSATVSVLLSFNAIHRNAEWIRWIPLLLGLLDSMGGASHSWKENDDDGDDDEKKWKAQPSSPAQIMNLRGYLRFRIDHDRMGATMWSGPPITICPWFWPDLLSY